MSLVLRASSSQLIGDVREGARSICQAKGYESCPRTNMGYGIALAILGLGICTVRCLTSGRFMFNSPEYAPRGGSIEYVWTTAPLQIFCRHTTCILKTPLS